MKNNFLYTKIRNFLLYSSDWIILILFTIYYGFYTYISMANVVFLGWFFQIPLFEKYLSGVMSFRDLFSRFGEHGMFGYNIISLVNLKYFHWNTLFDAYLNVFIVFLTGYIVLIEYKKSFGIKYSILHKILFSLLAFMLFNIMQQSSASMETQIRLGLLFFLFTSSLVGSYIISGIRNNKKIILIILMLFLSINIFGTFYSFSWFLGIFTITVVDFLKKKKLSGDKLLICLFMIIFCVLYFLEYSFFGISTSKSLDASLLDQIRLLVLSPVIAVRWILAYIGSSTLTRTFFEDGIIKNSFFFYINGLVVFLTYCYCIVRYVVSKMSKVTFLPILMICYSLFIGIMIMIGRFSNWDWGTNYWYAVHPKLGISACVWILIYDLMINIKNLRNMRKVFIPVFIIVFIVGSQFLSTLVDWRRAPWVKRWYEEKIMYMFNPEEKNVDAAGYTPLVVSYDQSIKVINFLKKYKLNVFNDLSKRNITKLSGWYGDNWIAKEAFLRIYDSKNGFLSIKVYLPKDIYSRVYNNSLKLEIIVDDKVVDVDSFDISDFNDAARELNFNLPKNTSFDLGIRLNKSYIPNMHDKSNNDLRELSVIISDFRIE